MDPIDMAKAAAAQTAVAPPSARTEAAAEAGTIPIVMDGKTYMVPALKIVQGEAWQKVVGGEVTALDNGLGGDADNIEDVLGRGTLAMLRLVVAYDVTEVLGGKAGIEAGMSQVELFAATELILEAEFPFDETGRRSVVKVFGLPLRALGIVTEAAEDAVQAEVSRSVKLASSRLPIGASPTPKSAKNGRANNSSSAGDTVKRASKKRSKRAS